MPILLAPNQAPSLQQLIDVVNQAGLECQLADAGSEPSLIIQGLGSLHSAGASELSFLSNPKLADQLESTGAAAVILRAEDYEALSFQPDFAVVLCNQPYVMYALLAQWFDQYRLQALATGWHNTAIIHDTAKVSPQAHIGPHVVIEAEAVVDEGVHIMAGCVIGAGSHIGAHSLLYPRVTLYHGVQVGARCIIHSGAVLGADGFGFAPDPRQSGAWAKISQIGGVRIGNDVEVGANTTIDRGALDDTIIADGVKLDNQIMVAHNVHIGAHTAIAACVGIAGSTHIGSRCIVGGAAMLSGHLTIVDDVQISGGTAITSSIHEPGQYTGVYPYQAHQQWQRNAAVISQLGALRRRVRALER